MTDDGGKTWKQTLFAGPESGVSDIAMSAQNPSVLYAGVWQFQRRPWTFTSGGDADGLYKSTDGGATGRSSRTRASRRDDRAASVWRLRRATAIAFTPLIESKSGVLWRSDDGGANWTMVSDDLAVDARSFYFSHVEVDPKNPNRVYAISFEVMLSTDGGKTFKPVADDVHSDFHAIWIAPNDPNRVIFGEDGGYVLTRRRRSELVLLGATCRSAKSIASVWETTIHTASARVCKTTTGGADRRTRSIRRVSKTSTGSTPGRRRDVGDSRARRSELDLVGCARRLAYHLQSRHARPVVGAALPANRERILGSRDEQVPLQLGVADRVCAVAQPEPENLSDGTAGTSSFKRPIAAARGPSSVRILRATSSRIRIPPAVRSRNDVSGAEYSDTIFDIEASQRAIGEIWVGTDDGFVQLTRDGGKHWRNVTPRSAPKFGRFATVAPSTLVDGTAYAIEDDHDMGDSAPYAFVTHDFGKTLDEDRPAVARRSVGCVRSGPTFATAISSISAPRRASGSRSTAERTGSRSRTTCRASRCTIFGMQPRETTW